MSHELIKNRRQLFFTQARQIGYVGVLSLSVLALWKLADIYKSELIVENGIVEIAQTVVLLLTTVSLCVQAYFNRLYRPLMLLLAALAFSAAIREQDSFLDAHLPLIGWKFAWIFPAAALFYISRNWRRNLRMFTEFLRSNSFSMMITALTIIIPVAQLLGHRSFLCDLLLIPDSDGVLIRRVLEEPIELMGYLQILLATAEFHIEQWLDRH